MPALTLLPFRNSANFSKVNPLEINQNAVIAKASTKGKTLNFTKLTRNEAN